MLQSSEQSTHTLPLSITGPPAEQSARHTLSTAQRVAGAASAAGCFLLLAIRPAWSLLTLTGVLVLGYLVAVTDRVLLVRAGCRAELFLRVNDQEADALTDDQLPPYTVLVPAYREPEVIGDLLKALGALKYPQQKLEILLLLEADDDLTRDAVAAADTHRTVRVVTVQPGTPRTKPRACNVGLEQANGTYVTIYDAEDRPEPRQLRRAVAAFNRVDQQVVCLQAVLAFYNTTQNFITRSFAAEYTMWFRWLLPGLMQRHAPVPLGGTSNHFRTDVLRRLGGWDPWNVTEDADLGVRLHRQGLRTALLDSVTLEEANSDFVNWVKQRSRWYKGYLITALVHLRNPRKLRSQIGLRATLGFLVFVGGTPLLAAANLVFWLLTAAWFLGSDPVRELFPPQLYYPGLACALAGNAAMAYLHLLAAHRTREPSAVSAALAVPVYWAMMAVAACKALIQLMHAPSFWEKTTHGLAHSAPQPSRPTEPAAPTATTLGSTS